MSEKDDYRERPRVYLAEDGTFLARGTGHELAEQVSELREACRKAISCASLPDAVRELCLEAVRGPMSEPTHTPCPFCGGEPEAHAWAAWDRDPLDAADRDFVELCRKHGGTHEQVLVSAIDRLDGRVRSLQACLAAEGDGNAKGAG